MVFLPVVGVKSSWIITELSWHTAIKIGHIGQICFFYCHSTVGRRDSGILRFRIEVCYILGHYGVMINAQIQL